jgi:1-hydroxycarotenoid 3,4-desaturase
VQGRNAIVIGAGAGGLAAAIQLQRAGVKTTVLERANHPGGKLREAEVGGKKFLAGPSVFTMRHVFEELFAPARLEDYVTLEALEPLCRHFFADGSQLDLFLDEEKSRAAIEQFAGAREARGYLAFRKQAAKIYQVVRGPFMEQPIDVLGLLKNPMAVFGMTQIDGLRTMWRALEEHFADPRLRQLFGRYATYNGSSPFHAPATLAVIVHVENAFGIFAVKGGIYRLAEAMEKRARDLGVEFRYCADVEQIVVESGRARGVRVGGETLPAELVMANADASHVYGRLLGMRKQQNKYEREELSLSAYVLLAMAKKAPLELLHHNVFFSRDYKWEFGQLVAERRPPDDPTVYLCREDPDQPVERCFLLTNAPPLDDKGARVDWTSEAPRCRQRILDVLKRHGWDLKIEAESQITPADFAERFPSSRGAIYGLASNSKMAAFKRPANQVSGVAGLFLCGGSVHPGAGLPMVCLSAKIASKLALEGMHAR